MPVVKVELDVQIQDEPGEEQVKDLLGRISHVHLLRDGLSNWYAVLVGVDGWAIERLWYQNPYPDDLDGDEGGPIGLCHDWVARQYAENEADLRVSPEWGSLAVAVLRRIAFVSENVFRDEINDRWHRSLRTEHAVVVARSATGRIRSLVEVARDDPVIVPILCDAWREELP